MEKKTFIAKTLFGLESVLAKELKILGAAEIEELHRAVSFKGDLQLLYRANFSLRTAIRIIKPIVEFEAIDEDMLYEGVSKVDWSKYMDIENTFAIDANLFSSAITHSQYAAQKTKDAIVDQFRTNFGKRPSVDLDDPDVRFNVRISRDICTISLDSSGDLLNKRGYRSKAVLAPLNEVLAAGLIMLSGWDKKSPFIDPMCGSGTFSIEAALIAKNIPPGFLRKKYGFEKWKDFDEKLWKAVKDDIFRKKTTRLNAQIIASDIDKQNLRTARMNIDNANLSHEIITELRPFDQQIPPKGDGVVILNPPYGERLDPENLNNLYKQIGDHLKRRFSGYKAWILTSNPEAVKHIGLRPFRKFKVFNGPLECVFLGFDLYEGTKKLHKLKKNAEEPLD